MGRKKKRRNSKNGTQSIFALARKVALGASAIHHVMRDAPWNSKVKWIVRDYTGYNMDSDRLEVGYLKRGYGPYLAVKVVHKGIAAISRMIGSL